MSPNSDNLLRISFIHETLIAMSVSINASENGMSPWDSQHLKQDYEVGEIEGTIPDDLRGVLYRIGPGRLDIDGHPMGHIFDGDGMVSRFEIGPSGVRYRNRYVRTRAFRRTNETGKWPRGFATQRLGGPLANAMRFPENMANTNVLVHDDALYALWEGGKPHRLDPLTLDTEGTESFGGALKRLGAFSAHPKADPATGEVFNFGVDFFPRPMIRCYRLDRGGRLHGIATVPITKLGFVHDFALTDRHLVFILGPLVVRKPVSVALGLRPFDEALSYRPELGTTIVLVPRGGGPGTRMETDALFHFHVTNAYEHGANTVVDIVAHNADGGWMQWENHLRRFRDNPGPAFGGTLTRLTIDPAAGKVTHEQLNDRGCEFPQLDPRRITREHRFSYLAEASRSGGDPDSIATVDHRTGNTSRYTVPDGNTICEPLFAPRTTPGNEGDGWLLTLEHEPLHRRSRLTILRADRPDDGPIATAPLEHHVPMTFHGTYVPAT